MSDAGVRSRSSGAAIASALAACLLALHPVGSPSAAPRDFTWVAPGCAPTTPVQAADFLLEHMSQILWDPVDPTQLGSLDPRLQTKVNGEVYRFARAATLARFRRDPARWCGLLRDPVSGVRFVPDASSPRLTYQAIPYFFACDSTRAVFVASPQRWAIHR